MGLDMYLNASRYLWSFNPEAEDAKTATAIRNLLQAPEGFEVREINGEVGYWQKANQIHKWFVDNVQDGVDDCRTADVDTDDFTVLLDICQKIKADHSLAEELLPIQRGFFFGNYEYNEFYFQDIDDTIAILEKVMSPEYENFTFTYRSYW